MSTVVMIAVGSRGDVAPLTGLGVRLQQAGHEVAIAAFTPFAELITNCGLQFRELPSDFDPAADNAAVNPAKGMADFFAPRGMRATGEAILSVLGAPAARHRCVRRDNPLPQAHRGPACCRH